MFQVSKGYYKHMYYKAFSLLCNAYKHLLPYAEEKENICVRVLSCIGKKNVKINTPKKKRKQEKYSIERSRWPEKVFL